MGQPPQFRLSRKLIKGFFNEKLRQIQGKEFKEKFDDVLECWATHGYNSIKCLPEMDLLDDVRDPKNNEKLKINGKKLHEYVIGEMNSIVYPKYEKGKNKDFYTGFRHSVKSIYDGVQMQKDPK